VVACGDPVGDRAHEVIEKDLQPGRHYLIVDGVGPDDQCPFELKVEAVR
jgi:hypothetical protein